MGKILNRIEKYMIIGIIALAIILITNKCITLIHIKKYENGTIENRK